MKSAVVAALIAGLLLFFPIGNAQATCQCPAISQDELQDSITSIFTGSISEIHKDKKTGQQTIVFDVDETFKGIPEPEMEITDALAGTECAIDFKTDQSYMVYVHWQWGTRVTSHCLGTKLLDKAADDAKKVGPSDVWKTQLYEQLQMMCMGKRTTPCCLQSVKTMNEGYYLPEPDDGCPAGQGPTRLRCLGGYEWCIPVEKAGHPE